MSESGAESPIVNDAVLWSTPEHESDPRPTIVLLHGYGSDERDLFGLVPHLPEEFIYAAVRAPLTPPWPAPGFSWYPIEGLDGRSGEHVTAGAQTLLDWLDTQNLTSVGLLGFSQGGAISLQALRLAPERFDFAVNLSGYVAAGDLPGDAGLREQKPPVFWGRGSHDEVIPEPLIAHTIEWLPGYTELSGRVYTGLGHAVSQEELTDLTVFLRKRLEEHSAEPTTE